MSIARHHNEWLSLLEVSGPFLSMPVLMRAFPQGLDALDRPLLAELRLAFEEWLDDQNSLKPSPAIHSVWVRYIFENVLGFEKINLLEGPAIPGHLKAYVAEHGETLRPDLVISSTEESTQSIKVLVQIVPANQKLERVLQEKRWKASPAMRMMELLRSTGMQLGIVTNGDQWMLISAPRGETTTFVSWYAQLWLEEPLTLRAFCSLLSANRFFSVADEDTLDGILKASTNEQQEVTDQLGYQVRRAVEVLIRAVDKADQDRARALLKGISESELYEAALTVMMRLVFLFSAEERGLLLLGEPLYDQNYAVSTLRAQLREIADHQGEEVLERRFDAWCRLLATFRAVHGGIHHDRLNLPAYGGSLFDPTRFPFLEGRIASQPEAEAIPLPISNRTVLHLLEALQILRVKVPGGGPAEPRRLSFRALDVEQIGHVYEGLLDHEAVRSREPVLGLEGTRDKEPEIPLSTLKHEYDKGEKNFISFLNENTGRSESALRKALKVKLDVFDSQRLQIACNNDPQVFSQVETFAGLIRRDDCGYPTVFIEGSVYVTAGATRRATGTHYTPRSLTEPVVQHTLEPLVYSGPAEGWPKEQWKLKSPAEILDLKVCDMAMGSAGFLVQVIRYLSERLVEAWEEVSQEGNLQITPEGESATGKVSDWIIPNDDEEQLILARRLVADRCIYGVDKNPLAVEIAKLSIWLTTMDKGRPFTFLDHALKCGDSLVGASEDEFLRWARGYKDPVKTLFDEELHKQLELARQKRLELEAFEVREIRDAERKAQLLDDANAALAHIWRGCDLLAGTRLLGLTTKEEENLRLTILFPYMKGELNGEIHSLQQSEAVQGLLAAKRENAFHWEFAFPEVFAKDGFNAFVGNPPFLGGQRISGTLGDNYLGYLQNQWSHVRGSADICAYFFLRAYGLLKHGGTLGLIATNTIAQGDTRARGLDFIVSKQGIIYHARSSVSWPGQAAVFVSVLHIIKGKYSGQRELDGLLVDHVSPFLDNSSVFESPKTLVSNSGKSFQGSNVLGMGFIISEKEAKVLIEKNPKNSQVIFPFINGQDLNSRYDCSPSRWVINFFDWPLTKAEEFPDCLSIVKEKVLPERMKQNREIRKRYWWRYGEPAPNLYRAISTLERVLIIAQTSKTLAFTFMAKGLVYSHATIVFALDQFSDFSVLQSCFHTSWVLKYASTLKGDARYIPSDVFSTFPFPPTPLSSNVETTGNNFYQCRNQIMQNRREGLTAIYNRLHNGKENSPDFTHLRELQVVMDNAVASAFGWDDLELNHNFYETAHGLRFTISEIARREVLARLLRLNHERYEEEIRLGMHEKKRGKLEGKKKIKALKEGPEQYELF